LALRAAQQQQQQQQQPTLTSWAITCLLSAVWFCSPFSRPQSIFGDTTKPFFYKLLQSIRLLITFIIFADYRQNALRDLNMTLFLYAHGCFLKFFFVNFYVALML